MHSGRGRHRFEELMARILPFISQPDGCLESCIVTPGGGILGVDVRLCFICCPLQGGFNLQPTRPSHVIVNMPLFGLGSLRNFSVLTLDWSGRRHYQLNSYQMKLQVYRPLIPPVLEM